MEAGKWKMHQKPTKGWEATERKRNKTDRVSLVTIELGLVIIFMILLEKDTFLLQKE